MLSTSSASRDAAQCTRGLQDDSSDGPELNSCESERTCRHIWVSVGTSQSKASQTVSMGERGREGVGRGFQVLRGVVA